MRTLKHNIQVYYKTNSSRSSILIRVYMYRLIDLLKVVSTHIHAQTYNNIIDMLATDMQYIDGYCLIK